MSQVAIRAALETQLNTLTPAIETAYEDTAFVPPAPTVAWQQVRVLFATPDNPEAGAGYRELGYMQVDLKYPLQVGTAAVTARAALVRALFPKNLSLTKSGFVVTVSKTPEVGNGVPDGDHWSVPIKIPFFANIFS